MFTFVVTSYKSLIVSELDGFYFFKLSKSNGSSLYVISIPISFFIEPIQIIHLYSIFGSSGFHLITTSAISFPVPAQRWHGSLSFSFADP